MAYLQWGTDTTRFIGKTVWLRQPIRTSNKPHPHHPHLRLRLPAERLQ